MKLTAVLVGALFWISNIDTLVGNVMAGTVPNATEALNTMSLRKTQVAGATLIAHLNDVPIICCTVLLLTVLKRWSEALALAYMVFKTLQATLLAVGSATVLSLIGLSQQLSCVGHLGTWLLPGLGNAGALTAVLGRRPAAERARILLLQCSMALLYRSQLVPRFFVIRGFVALLLLAIGLATGVGDPTPGFEPGPLLVIPIILWEFYSRSG